MTLRDKFSKLIPFYSVKDNYAKSIECEKIANDYAIEFAEFVFWLSKREIRQEKQFFYKNEYKNIKKLLEIFKKEKGL